MLRWAVDGDGLAGSGFGGCGVAGLLPLPIWPVLDE